MATMLVIPNTFRTAGKNTPLYKLDENFAAIAAWINSRVATIGPILSRPLAGHAGALYVASDQHYAWYIDDGAVWQPVGGMGLDGAITVNVATLNVRLFGADAGTDGAKVITGLIGTPPTTAPPDVAHLGLLDTQGENGRARWHTFPETGGARPVDPVLFRRVGDVSGFLGVSGTLETTVGQWTVKAPTLVTRSLEVALRYDVASAGSARTITFRVKLGATTLLTAALNLPAMALGQGLYIGQIDPLTAAIQRAMHQVTTILPAASSQTLTQANGALDATTDLTLALTAQWGASGATLNAYTLTVRLI